MSRFHIDVDTLRISNAGNRLIELGNHLEKRADEVRRVPGDIPPREWSGAARKAITAEMTALGHQLGRFAPMFTTAGEALKKLSATAQSAQEASYDLLRRWDEVQAAYESSVRKANGAYFHEVIVPNLGPPPAAAPGASGSAAAAALPDAQTRRDSAISVAESVRAGGEGQLNREFNTLVADVEAAFVDTSKTLAGCTLIAVPDRIVAAFLDRHGGGGHVPATSRDNTSPYPTDVGVRELLGRDLALAARKRVLDDFSRVVVLADRLQDGGHVVPEHEHQPPLEAQQTVLDELDRLLERNRQDEVFAAEMVTRFGWRGLVQIYERVESLWTEGNAPRVRAIQHSAVVTRITADTALQAIRNGERLDGPVLADARRFKELGRQLLDDKGRSATPQELAELSDLLKGKNTDKLFAAEVVSTLGQRGLQEIGERVAVLSPGDGTAPEQTVIRDLAEVMRTADTAIGETWDGR